MLSLYKYIKQVRVMRDISQKIVATRLGVSRPTYVQIEHGKRDLTLSEAKKLAGILGVSFTEFCESRLPEEGAVMIKKGIRAKQKGSRLRISVPQRHLDKFKEVFLYIIEKIGCKPNVGQTVLYKLLYFIDFDFYEKYEEQLLGATYIKNHYGPTPLEFNTVVEAMKRAGEIQEVKSEYFQYPQTKYLPVRKANLACLTAIEKDHIDEVLTRLSDKSAKELSNYSHNDVPWITAQENNALDYEAVFYRTDLTSVREYDEV